MADKIESMRYAGKVLSSILDELESMVKPDVSSYDLEEKFIALCEKNKVIPSCKGYTGGAKSPFRTGLCLGINDDCVHCYPRKDKVFKEGDIAVIDTVIAYNGFHVDSARTVPVGKVSPERERIVNAAKMSLQAAINVVKAGNRVGDISNAFQTVIEMSGFTPMRGIAGHGIGREMHENPNIPCFGIKGTGPLLKEGMTLAVESLLSAGSKNFITTDREGWETKTGDGSDFAQYEHTVLVTKSGCEILTEN